MMRILAALFVWFGSTLAFAQAPLNGAVALGPLASAETRETVKHAESRPQALALLLMASEFQRR